MYIRKSTRSHKGKTYTNYLLVESILTPKGPRQRAICSLGNLAPAPPEEWLALARKLESALAGQLSLDAGDEKVDALVQAVRRGRKRKPKLVTERGGETITIDTDRVEMEDAREAGTVHVGHQMWQRLNLDGILSRAGLPERACRLSEAMTLNRLIFPLSELAMPEWIRRTAIGDIVGEDFSELAEDSLYRNLDLLHPNRERIEKELAERERTLFNLDDTVYLYDLTSTYFEGQAAANPHVSGRESAT